MSRNFDYIKSYKGTGATTFIQDPRGTSKLLCRLGYTFPPETPFRSLSLEAMKTLQKISDVVQSGLVLRCPQRGTDFDVYLAVLPPQSPTVSGSSSSSSRQTMKGTVHGRIFRHLAQELQLQRPLQLRLEIDFEAPLNKTVVTEVMSFIDSPKDKLWPKAFAFEMELEGDPWTIPETNTAVNYSMKVRLIARPFVKSAALGFILQNDDGEISQINKQMLEEDEDYRDFTLVSGNGKDQVRCHKIFLGKSSPFFDRMIQSNMKEGVEGECELDGSTKKGIEALLKFLYYRGVEEPLANSGVAYELLDLGEKYDIRRLKETMSGVLRAKLAEWWDLEVAMTLFLRARMENDDEDDEWKRLKEKAVNVLKMRSCEFMSDSNTLLDELWMRDSKAAKELNLLLLREDTSE